MAIRSGELSPTEHVADALDRLAADPYNLVVTLDAERALAQAAALTEELAQGRWRGPLHGVALGVKDLFDVAGLPTRCGSNVFADAPPATEDAPAVARLRAAGAVVVAKLHTQEFAHGPTGDAVGHRAPPATRTTRPGSPAARRRGRPARSRPGTCRWRWAPTPAAACAPPPRTAGSSGSSRRSGTFPSTGCSRWPSRWTTSVCSPRTCTAPPRPGTSSTGAPRAPAAASRRRACRG